jgi:taurine dioxygenase
MSALGIRRLGYALGADVTGLDLGAPLEASTVEQIRETIRDNLVLCFPKQNIDQAALMRLAEYFGEIEPASRENVDPDVPQVTYITNKPVNGKAWNKYQAGQNWHSDHSYTTQPTLYSFLACKEIPPVGGDTMFANMYMAYDSLSPKLQRIVDDLEGLHTRALPASYRGADGVEKQAALEQRDAAASAGRRPIAHPVARVHPETGKKTLYLGTRVRRFAGMTEDESKALIDYLNAHSVTYEFTYRHRWTVGDVLMWDNRSTMHIALSDYDLYRDARLMLRCSVQGEHSGYEYVEDGEPMTAGALA